MKLTVFDGICLFFYAMIGIAVGPPEAAGFWVLGWLGMMALFTGINNKAESMKDD